MKQGSEPSDVYERMDAAEAAQMDLAVAEYKLALNALMRQDEMFNRKKALMMCQSLKLTISFFATTTSAKLQLLLRIADRRRSPMSCSTNP